jgi:hypothetical protein
MPGDNWVNNYGYKEYRTLRYIINSSNFNTLMKLELLALG